MINPTEPNVRDLGSLVFAVESNMEWFEEKVAKNSVLLLRGFDVQDAEGFNSVVEAFRWEDIRYVGPAPRTHIYKRIWTANEGPLEEFIYYHNEMVLIKEFLTKVILWCDVPPLEGGETPFVPSFRVTERMVKEFPENIEEIKKKGLRYSFMDKSKNDEGSMRERRWEDAFGTADKIEAEKRAEALGMEIEWLVDGGAKTILGPRSLTRVFPKRNGRRMWFNTNIGMHGKDISSAEMADGSEILADVVKRCGEIIEESIQLEAVGERGQLI